VAGKLQSPSGGEAGFDDRVGVTRRADAERPLIATKGGIAAIIAGAALPRFLPAEVRQDIGIRPAGEPGGGPAVVIAGVAADIGHRVDRRAAADDLAAGAFDAPAVNVRLGLGEVHPVVQPPLEDAAPAERDLDPRVAVPPAGFQQQHPNVGVLG
jgi:hypothetical protein